MTDVFDLCGELPTGTTVLEASAGTGKTHTIATLAARYVAEGVARIDELMLVTFGRAATVELRERVRERLVATCDALGDPVAARVSDDEVVRHLAGADDDRADDDLVALRHRRLAHAVANFDAATIATTHGFCHQMLAGLGIAADIDRDVTFAESTAEVVTETVNDLYVRAYARATSGAPPFTMATAGKIARDAVGDRQARLEPVAAARDSAADLRRRLAERVRAEVERRKRDRRLLDYDDLLVLLRDALTDPTTGADAQARIRGRYVVVLVDEFQDTDPVQWQILESAFHGHRTLVLIGDPKQAIYAFRGADVVTYLLATGTAGTTSTLGTNWRSDAPLVDALGHVMGSVALGDDRIVVHPVGAANLAPRLRGAPVDAAFRIRVVDRDQLSPGNNNLVPVGTARPYVARDVAADIVALLSSAARVHGRDGADRAVEPADIAVLVQRNEDGATVRDELRTACVPVVLTGTSSVFLSAAATDWLTLLTALEQPHRPGLARAAALTSFVGWSAAQLASDDDAMFDGLSAQLHAWAEVLTRSGVAAMFEVVVGGYRLVERVLATEQGERHLTDLRHIGQTLHEAATDGQLGVASLVEWLQRRMAEEAADVSEERSRRLESDAEAVQIITVHRSKGLEFPIVYVPFVWSRHVYANPDPLSLHDDTGARVLDVGGPGAEGYDARRVVHLHEDAGESLRLAYVALTRARSQVVVHWAPTSNTAGSPLQRLLFGDRTTGAELPETVRVGSDDFVRRTLGELCDRSGGTVSVESATGGTGTTWRPPASPRPELSVRRFDRSLDLAWTRTSYSGLISGLHDLQRGSPSEAEEPGTVDEPDTVASPGAVSTSETPAGVPSPMADLPAGAAFGTLVHGVLENLDFAVPDLRAHLVEQCEAAASQAYAGVPAADLAAALEPALRTSLGPLAGGRRLADITRADRLDELDFELPLLGGNTPTGEARVGEIADLLRQHLPDSDPLRAYVDDLAAPTLAARQLRGFLGGSIDVVLRLRDEGGEPRYLVVDYKTNRLGADEPLTSWDYRPEPMAHAMRHAHYPLQALLYSVALHRFLRWRQTGYDPAVHLGGVLYLFLRGMCGPDTPEVDGMVCGVFGWSPAPALIEDLSALLDRGAR